MSEESATPTAVIVMAFNAIVGFALQVLVLRDFPAQVLLGLILLELLSTILLLKCRCLLSCQPWRQCWCFLSSTLSCSGIAAINSIRITQRIQLPRGNDEYAPP